VHSVDRSSLLRPLSAGAAAAQHRLAVLAQVSLDDDPARGGVPIDRLLPLADTIAGTDGLDLLGLMAVAPLGADPHRAFTRLAEAATALRLEHPAATWVSAGMSGDLEAAVAAGATHLRVGSAILGSRPRLG
jgi:uncharacterized pyridoxal phosphate-containing UPF0001 family protein